MLCQAMGGCKVTARATARPPLGHALRPRGDTSRCCPGFEHRCPYLIAHCESAASSSASVNVPFGSTLYRKAPVKLPEWRVEHTLVRRLQQGIWV